MDKVVILDSTLRDGAQGEGISFSLQDKLAIATALDNLGIDYIEAGNPFSNPKDMEFFEMVKTKKKFKHSTLVAFGSTRRKDKTVEEDKNIKALLDTETSAVAVFGKSWLLHVTEILATDGETNLSMIYDTVKYLKDKGKEVFFDAEHFFDGYKDNKEYAIKVLQTAYDAGADALVLCDTNGGAFPDEIFEICQEMNSLFPGKIGIHTHNDRGMAVANTVMAVKAGATHVQGTYLGFGERCGNANLSTIIPNLTIKMNKTCIPEGKLSKITPSARKIAEICNISIKRNEPYTGTAAFAHKAGMHADGVLKLSRSFEHISPETVGNTRKILMSEITGRGAVLQEIKKINPHITKDSPETLKVLEELKKLEAQGYQFEGADSSFEMLIRRCLGAYKNFFELLNYKIVTGRPCEDGCSATATVKVKVGDKTQLMAAEGNGPINAFDKALRFALEVFYPSLVKMRLIDYKVRVMESKKATAAPVRVLITSTDGKHIWTTIGVSGDVVDASRLALTESIEYKLIKDTVDNAFFLIPQGSAY